MKMSYKTLIVLVLIISILSGCSAGQADSFNGQTNINGELTIATFIENSFLEFAARKYEELNEGVTVTIHVYIDENERDAAKFSQIINTSLMSGRGEDIIDVGYIDWVTLADSNRLLDLNGKIDFTPETHYQSVLDAYLYNGGRYAVPLSFYFSAYKFDDAFSHMEKPNPLTLDKMLVLAAEHPNTRLVISGAGFDMVSLANMMFSLNFHDFIDVKNKTAHVDNEMFKNLLEDIYSMSDNFLVQNELGVPVLMWEDALYNPAMSMNGLEDYSDMFLLTNNKGEALFSPIGFLPALNANSANQGLAVSFMQFLLSEEMQSSPELMFNPVNKNSSAEMAALVLESIRAGGYAAPDFDLDRNIAVFNKFAESLKVVKHSDSFINDFVRTELTRFFDGEVSAEQAARNLQSRLTTYLNE